jgi:hypothetical protein
MNEFESEDGYDLKIEEIEEAITEVSDKYSDYIESITIKYKEEKK